MGPPSSPLTLEPVQVATPERVALGLPTAGVGYRCLAYLVDGVLIFFFWVSAYFIYSLVEADLVGQVRGLSGLGWTLIILGIFATQWLYWTICEVLFSGQTPGKRALRVRVVRLDGSPVGFFESAVRNLCRVVDFLPAFYALGLVVMFVTRHHVRLGDLLAGTVLVRDERPSLDRYAALSSGLTGAPHLDAHQTELVLEYLARAPSLEPPSRAQVGLALLERLGKSLPPQTLVSARAAPETAEAILRSWVEGPRS